MRKKLYIILIVVIALSATGINYNDISAKTVNDLEKEINELEKEQKDLNNNKSEIEEKKNSVSDQMELNLSKQDVVQADLDNINIKLSNTEKEITEKEAELVALKEELENLNEEIKILNEEIEELIVKIDKRTELLKDRLRSMQGNGGMVKYISVILGAQSFGDLISRSSTVSSIMDQDKNIMENLEKDQQALERKQLEVEEKKKSAEDKKVQREEEKEKLDELQALLDAQKAEQTRIQNELVEAFNKLKEHNLNLEEEAKIIAAEAAALETLKKQAASQINKIKKAEEAAKKQENKPSSNGGSIVGGGNGLFQWPLNKGDISRISSEFQPNRVHPIYGYARPHNGMDIAAPTGKVVKAAETGIVTTAVNNRGNKGLGTYIILTHYINGRTYSTVYGHLNSLSVSQGETVSVGQQIGTVGSTGASTGPHLHFEIHPGGYGYPTNPRNFLP